MVRLYHMAGYEEYAERAENCATYLRFGIVGDKRGLLSANFCHLRLCPICIARGAVIRGKLLSKVMNAVQAEHKCKYVFLTLALRNVPGSELGDAIGQLTKAWDRLMKQRPVARAFKGTCRCVEITRNNDPASPWYGTFHPHIHAVVAVEEEYFAKNSPIYLEQADLLVRWQKAAKVNYAPTCHIEATYEGKDGKKKRRKKKVKKGDDAANKGAVLEAAKYATKDRDYISDELSDEEAAQVVADYTKALYHRRLIAYTGWLKDMAVRLQADDLDNVDLEQGDDATIREDLAEVIEEYGWHFGAGDYVLARRYVNPLRIKREGDENVGGK